MSTEKVERTRVKGRRLKWKKGKDLSMRYQRRKEVRETLSIEDSDLSNVDRLGLCGEE